MLKNVGKRNAGIFMAVLLSVSVFISGGNAFAIDNQQEDSLIYSVVAYQQPFSEERIIVALKEGCESLSKADKVSEAGISLAQELGEFKNPKSLDKDNKGQEKKLLLYTVKNKGKKGVLDAVKKLKNDPNVAYVEPDYKISVETTTPNDPGFSRLYGMNKIKAPQVWDRYTGSSSVVVGVIDTGIDYTHTDLKDNMWINLGEIRGNGIDDDRNGYIDDVYGWDFVNNDNDPMDDEGHGTHVAGTIGATGNNGIGVTGVSWRVKMAALKFLDSNGDGYTSNAIKAVKYANAMGFPITNNSWGGGGYSQSLKDAIAAGGLFVAAAGNKTNNNDSNAHYPSSYDLSNIIAVAATDSNDNLSYFSNYGKNSVDIAAPGSSIYSCARGGGYTYMSGTSMATPHVAGVAALYKGYRPEATAIGLKSAILDNVDKLSQLSNVVSTGGRLNACILDATFVNIYNSHNGIAGYDMKSTADQVIEFDYNGDGKDDTFMYRPGHGAVYIARSNGNGTFTNVYASHNGIAGYDMKSSADRAIKFDYNGDGKDDIFMYRPGYGPVYIARSNGNGTFTNVYASHNGIAGYDMKSSADRAMKFDYNGDGKDDIFMYRPGHGAVYIGRSNGDGTFTNVYASHNGIAGYDMKSSVDQVLDFDYDGDGKDDLFMYRPGHGAVYIGRSNGNGTFTNVYASHNGIAGYDMKSSADRVLKFDWNGDGRDDIFMYRPGHGAVYIGRSNGNGTFTNIYASHNGIAGYDMKHYRDRVIKFDYNGDGKDDIFMFRPGNGPVYISRS